MVQVKDEFLDIMWTAPAMEAIQSGEHHDLDVPLYGRYGHDSTTVHLTLHTTQSLTPETSQ